MNSTGSLYNNAAALSVVVLVGKLIGDALLGIDLA